MLSQKMIPTGMTNRFFFQFRTRLAGCNVATPIRTAKGMHHPNGFHQGLRVRHCKATANPAKANRMIARIILRAILSALFVMKLIG